MDGFPHLVHDPLNPPVWQLHRVFAVSLVAVPVLLLSEGLVLVAVAGVVHVIAEGVDRRAVRIVRQVVVGRGRGGGGGGGGQGQEE